MRQIKFRGLRTDGKGWVYGYFYSVEVAMGDLAIIRDREGNSFQVTWDSVGQFTGLKDVDCCEIYEGDKIFLTANSESKQLGKAQGQWFTKCYFNKSRSKFLLRCIENPKLEWGFNDLDFNGYPFIKQIIGNIHETK